MSVARHTAYNLAGGVVPLLVSLVTVPIYLKVIGLDRYGVLAICWLLVGYFNLFDFGLGRATAQKIATLTDASAAARSRIFWTSALLSSGLCLTAILAFLPFAVTGLGIMKVGDAALKHEVREAMPLVVAAVPFGIAQSLLVGALEGRREFLRINLIVSSGTVATAILPLLAALWISPGLPFLIGASLVARTFVLLLLSLVCARALPLMKPQVTSSREMRSLLRFGGWTTISNVVGPLLVFLDRFAVGAVLSASAVTLYVVPFNLVSQLVLLPGALATALFPRMASLSADDARKMSRDSLLALAFLLTPMTLVMMVGVGPFLHLWIGEKAARVSTPVGVILLFGFWANSLARITAARLQSGGLPNLLAKAHLAEIVPYLGVLYFGIVRFGLIGAAAAWSIRCTADAVILILFDRVERPTLRLVAIYAAIVLAGLAVTALTAPVSIYRWLLLTALAAVMIAVLIRNIPSRFVGLVGRNGINKKAKEEAAS